MKNIKKAKTYQFKCPNCNKKINKNTRFIYVKFLQLFEHKLIDANPRMYCSTECVKKAEPELIPFIADLIKNHRILRMYNPNNITFPNILSMGDVETSANPEVKAMLDSLYLIQTKHKTNRVYVELNCTIDKLINRKELQEKGKNTKQAYGISFGTNKAYINPIDKSLHTVGTNDDRCKNK